MRRATYALLAMTALSPSWLAAAPPGGEAASWCGTSRDGARGAIAAHREQEKQGGFRALSARTTSVDVGDIAVLRDEGDLALFQRLFDLQRLTLRFAPVGTSGFAVTQVTAPGFVEASTPLALGDDDDEAVALPFAFPFYGTAYRTVFVSSDGNVTFGAADGATGARDLARLLEGPPRIAPLLADLDPTAAGSVVWSTAGDRFSVTWAGVPQFGRGDRNTFQVSLYADGRVEMAYAGDVSPQIAEGAIGIAPGGGAAGFTPVDFRVAAGQQGASLGQSVRSSNGIDMVAVARKFYRDHGDDFDQLVVFTNYRLENAGFAYEQTVRNEVEGLGDDVFDLSASFGSAGRLSSVIMMDAIFKYPVDPTSQVIGYASSLGVLAHEVGHRWLAYATFRDGERVSDELLGRQSAHWSFFLDTDGSHVEGNDIVDLGDGRFRTVDAVVRYSPLDQYLMGLRDAAEVPPFFVRDPDPVGPTVDPTRGPQIGVTFNGTRKDVTIADVVAALGLRRPATAAAPRGFRQAFVFVEVGQPATALDLQKVERIRAAWEPFFAHSTQGRGSVDTRLR